MSQKAKVIETPEGDISLTHYNWNGDRFSQMIKNQHPMDDQQADSIGRYVRETIDELSINRITPPIVDAILNETLEEYGLPKITGLPLDKSLFIRNGLKLTDNAKTVLERRYLRKDKQGKPVELAAQMLRRVAKHIAQADKQYMPETDLLATEEEFYDLMAELKFLPNSPTLMNAGRSLGQLAACFVLPVEDRMEGIFDTLKNAAIIHKSGGGTGFSFSRLRPKNSMVGTTGGVASGPVSFMKIFNTATEQVKQGGTRRGANMAILKVDHPDIMEFITCKSRNNELNNFNISVGLTDEFMAAVENGGTYHLLNPRDNHTEAILDAREVYDTLIRNAWENGDPGVVFLDRMNRDNPTPDIADIESTNPCGEQPLLPMEACNLGSINLAIFVKQAGEARVIDYDELRRVIWSAVHFLDNTIDMSRYPLPEIEAMVKGNRKVGLGVMGFADLLFRLGVPYDSEDALSLAEEVMAFVRAEAHEASMALAAARGSFLNHEQSIFKDGDRGMRNATLTTIAPTGTLSIIANCSSGIEPLFALSFTRTVMDNDRLTEVNPYFEKAAKERGFYSAELMAAIAQSGSIQDMEGIPEDIKSVYVTAHDVTPEWHIRMQAAFQKYTDNAVSKTVNLPRDSTEADVRKIYDLAYDLGCKGVTIYRDGSKDNQVLATQSGADTDNAGEPITPTRERPETLEGFTTKVKTGLGRLYVTVTELDGKPFEVFATIGKSGRSTTAKTEAIGRLISLSLRAGVDVSEIIEQLKGIGGEHAVFHDGELVLSIPDAIGHVLEKRYRRDGSIPTKAHGTDLSGKACPECGQTVSFEEGCQKCHSCGYTKCN